MKRLLSIAALALLASQAAAQESCKLTALGTAQVAAVRDGRTLLLADGREVRLAGIEVRRIAARAALQRLIARPAGAARSGLSAGARPLWPRRRLRLCRRRAGNPCSRRCWSRGRRGWRRGPAARPAPSALLAAEAAARAAARGLWADPNFAPLTRRKWRWPAGRTGSICAGRGQGLVGARERRHYICEFRAALDAGFQRHRPAPQSAHV